MKQYISSDRELVEVSYIGYRMIAKKPSTDGFFVVVCPANAERNCLFPAHRTALVKIPFSSSTENV